jgi:choline dehydrogenase-like flavoprotein
MATLLKEVDAVVIGVGWTGSILARELTKAGLNVVGLERGAKRTPRDDFTLPSVRDELKYVNRHELFQDTQMETVTLRHSPAETALPIRRDRSCPAPTWAAPAPIGTAIPGGCCPTTTSRAARSSSAMAATPYRRR